MTDRPPDHPTDSRWEVSLPKNLKLDIKDLILYTFHGEKKIELQLPLPQPLRVVKSRYNLSPVSHLLLYELDNLPLPLQLQLHFVLG